MRNEDRDLEPDYLEEHLVRRRHAISDHVVGLALFAVSILAMAIGLDSVPAQTAPASDRPMAAFTIAGLVMPCIEEKSPSRASAEATRLYRMPEAESGMAFALRKMPSGSVATR